MTAWYNEFDKEKAAWLRELIKAGLIAPGDVDERGIENVHAADLVGYTQCHFFAGIGIWSYALRLAGWPDNRPVWTGSCPCPSFSAAGKGAGFDDPRHLWPHWARLIRERKPPTVFGEQVDDAIGFGWLDLVQTDLEAEGYAVGKAVLGACSVGAPHIRQRLYFVGIGVGLADAEHPERRAISVHGSDGCDRQDTGRDEAHSIAGTCCEVRKLADSRLVGPRGRRSSGTGAEPGAVERSGGLRDALFVGSPTIGGLPMRGGAPGDSGRPSLAGGTDGMEHSFQSRLEGQSGNGDEGNEPRWDGAGAAGSASEAGEPLGLADAECGTAERQRFDVGTAPSGTEVGRQERQRLWNDTRPSEFPSDGRGRPGPVNGFWRDADWIRCRDARWRPVRPGSLPLATGTSARVVRLRGYGDGITAQTAQAFIESSMEVLDTNSRFTSGPLPHSNEKISHKGA